MTVTTEPSAPGTPATPVPSATVILTQADLEQLAKQFIAVAKADVAAEPSKLVTQIKAGATSLWSNSPQIVVALMAAAGLALHFVKFPL
jgi:hypothetical protein